MKSEKSCRHEKLMGSQTPSDRIVPDYAYTDGPDAVKVLAVGKLIVDPWQSEVLNDWMGRTEDDVMWLICSKTERKNLGYFRANCIRNDPVCRMGNIYGSSAENCN